MPETSDEIVLPLVLATEKAEADLEQFKGRAKQHGQQAVKAFEDGTRGVESGNFFDRHRGKMLEYRREEVQQQRSTRFFANELMSLVPAGAQAAGAISKIAV